MQLKIQFFFSCWHNFDRPYHEAIKATLWGLRAVGLAPLMKINRYFQQPLAKDLSCREKASSQEWAGKKLLHHLPALRDSDRTGRGTPVSPVWGQGNAVCSTGSQPCVGVLGSETFFRGMRESEVWDLLCSWWQPLLQRARTPHGYEIQGCGSISHQISQIHLGSFLCIHQALDTISPCRSSRVSHTFTGLGKFAPPQSCGGSLPPSEMSCKALVSLESLACPSEPRAAPQHSPGRSPAPGEGPKLESGSRCCKSRPAQHC